MTTSNVPDDQERFQSFQRRNNPERVQWQPMPAAPPLERERSNWTLRLTVLVLICAMLSLVLKFLHDIYATLSSISDIGHGTPEQQARGLVVVGVIGAILVAVLRTTIELARKK